jgi:hypothetical protein
MLPYLLSSDSKGSASRPATRSADLFYTNRGFPGRSTLGGPEMPILLSDFFLIPMPGANFNATLSQPGLT